MRFTNQITNGTIAVTEAHHAGWTGMDTQLMFERDRIYIIVLANIAILINQVFGYQE